MEAILALKSSDGNCGGGYERFAEEIKKRGLGLDLQELISLDAAKSVYSSLVDQMTPLRAVVDTDRPGLWEERSEAVGLKQKLHKYKRNKKWKKKKRKRIAEMILKVKKSEILIIIFPLFVKYQNIERKRNGILISFFKIF